MQSPCIQMCKLDPTESHCLGCGRSLGELAAWAGASEAEQARIVAAGRARLEARAATPGKRPGQARPG